MDAATIIHLSGINSPKTCTSNSPRGGGYVVERASFSFGRFQSSEGLPEIARPVVGEAAAVDDALQLKAIPFIEQFLGRKSVSGLVNWGVSAIDLQEEPAVLLPNPFDALVLYVTQAALDEIAYAHRVPRVEHLVWPQGAFDSVVHHLGQTLLSSLDQPHHAPKIFLDHVLQAMNCHFVFAYGGARISAPSFRGGLSSRQMRRATELLEAHLDGDISLSRSRKHVNWP